MGTQVPETTTPLQLLIVDDNQGDIQLMMEAAKESAPGLDITYATEGDKAMETLRNRHDVGRPVDLVLLDLNMPRKNGFAVLEEIRKDKALKDTPVLIFTSSRSEQDVRRAYELKGNAYLNKPVEWADLRVLMRSIQDFWGRNIVAPDGVKSDFFPT